MKLTKKIQKALNVAATLHKDQKRKGVPVPYIVHPFAVSIILSNYTNDEDIIIAGILHDVLEDCSYTREQLIADFGQNIANIVMDVTEDLELKKEASKKDSWLERKNKYLEHLETSTEAALLVATADKINNLRTLGDAIEVDGEKVWDNFNSSPEQIRWYHQEILRIAKDKLPAEIIEELIDAMKVFDRIK